MYTYLDFRLTDLLSLIVSLIRQSNLTETAREMHCPLVQNYNGADGTTLRLMGILRCAKHCYTMVLMFGMLMMRGLLLYIWQ